MRAPNSTRQRTYTREGRKVRVVSRRITRLANHMGYKVIVSQPENRLAFKISYHFHGALDREKVEQEALDAYVSTQITQE